MESLNVFAIKKILYATLSVIPGREHLRARPLSRDPRVKPGEESSLGTRFREDERHEEVHVDTDLAHNTRGEVTAT